MDILLKASDVGILNAEIQISGSKSESNRLLILQKLFSNLEIENLSDSDDTEHMQEALTSTSNLVDVGHAGTAMRFLTSYFAISENREVVLTGSDRMQNRPIRILVDALRELGASIDYMDKEGYPPLQIKGSNFNKASVSILGSVSSQYISSLLLIGAKLPKGLEIHLQGEITSLPYIKMTLALLNQVGIKSSFDDKTVRVFPASTMEEKTITVESDWSSASYYYSIVALSPIGSQITLNSYRKESLQGDACLAEIYEHFGVLTEFKKNKIILQKVEQSSDETLDLDLKNAPDIAQTIAVTCFALGVSCNLIGLHTLKIKETDRLVALENELSKFGATVSVTDKSLHLKKSEKINSEVAIETYNDHRMAMAFAPLALQVPLTIRDANVVTKSYKNFWGDLQSLGFTIN